MMRRLARAAIGAKTVWPATFGSFVDSSLGGVSTIDH